MAKRKRASSSSRSRSRGGFINQAVKAGQSTLRNLQRQVPPDLRKSIEATGKSFEKSLTAGLKQIQTQLNRTASQADVQKIHKRFDELVKRVEQMERRTTRSASKTSSRASSGAKRTASRTRRTAARRTASAARRVERGAERQAESSSSSS